MYLTGARVNLVRFGSQHVTEEYLSWLQDEEVNKFLFIGRFPVSKENIVFPSEKDDRNLVFAVFVENKYIGTCSLHKIDVINRNAEIGYMIGDRKYWGKGMATETVALLTNYGFNRLNLHKIVADIRGPNIGSIKVLEKNGYVRFAINPEDHFLDGKFMDSYLFCKFARDQKEI